MAKLKVPTTTRTTSTSPSTLSNLQSNPEIWYKIHILLYDLQNIANDRSSEARTLATTDELYISEPYFSPEEAVMIKTSLVSVSCSLLSESEIESEEFESLCIDDDDDDDNDDANEIVDENSEEEPIPIPTRTSIPTRTPTRTPTPETTTTTTTTIETAIKSRLENFFEKRRASGDARPCGPHDMVPIYQAVFGITKADLKNEIFLRRLRRIGLGREREIEKGKGKGKEKNASEDKGKSESVGESAFCKQKKKK